MVKLNLHLPEPGGLEASMGLSEETWIGSNLISGERGGLEHPGPNPGLGSKQGDELRQVHGSLGERLDSPIAAPRAEYSCFLSWLSRVPATARGATEAEVIAIGKYSPANRALAYSWSVVTKLGQLAT